MPYNVAVLARSTSHGLCSTKADAGSIERERESAQPVVVGKQAVVIHSTVSTRRGEKLHVDR